jgi:hypothetical protein
MMPEPTEILVGWPRPDPAVVWRAIDLYLSSAYADAIPSTAVRRRLEMLPRECGIAEFYANSVFESSGTPVPDRYALRLGNSIYPHMKLLIIPAPRGDSYLFRADTHDRHVQVAPDAPEYSALCEMLAKNHAVGTKIESAWESAGLPTFKQYLRQDLARRRASEL